MNLRTLLQFLFTGSAESMRAIAASRAALWVGLAFVMSAGLAREYDGEYLRADWWVLAVPLVAALAMSTVLFLPMYSLMQPRPRFWAAYRGFLSLFLMTAPLAWLYAVPYERFLSPLGATAANLWTLAGVAAWRVLLTARVVRVLSGRNIVASFCFVMLVADLAMLVALAYAPLPVLDFMGGLRQSERERMVASAKFLVQVGGVLSLLVWVIGTGFWIARRGVPQVDPEPATRTRGPSLPLAAVVVASLAVWALVLPTTQAEQRHRHEVERLFVTGKYAEGLTAMSRQARDVFPPQWDPPPNPGRNGVTEGDMLAVVEALVHEPHAEWVGDVYAEKFARFVSAPWYHWRFDKDDEIDALLARFDRLQETLPRTAAWAAARENLANTILAIEEHTARKAPATAPAP